MPNISYNISLKDYVGGLDFNRSTVDKTLAKFEGKQANVLIDSLGGSLATGLFISAVSQNHDKVNVHHLALEEVALRHKSDPDMEEKFAAGMNTHIRQFLGHSLASGDWCIVTSPSSTKSLCSAKNRRHKERNCASLISARLSQLLGIPFYEDIAECHSKHRVGAVFTFEAKPQE